MKKILTATFVLFTVTLFSQNDSSLKIPFDGMDLSWVNGQNRQKNFPLTFKDKKTDETILTGVAYVDSYFNYNFSNPIDNTHSISSTIGRNNEFIVNLACIGIETNYKNVIGRLSLQAGNMLNIVQEQDASVLRGRNTSINTLRTIREAAAGYHFNKWYGVNVEMGIFMSYIGLESYTTQENWCYQRAMISDFTPYYLSGARIQIFPSKKYRTELWLLNGWQSYNSWYKGIGFGNSNCYRPNENTQLIANFYIGKDDKQGTTGFHHDNSIVKRYCNKPASTGISQAAFSLNNHYGFQSGNGIKASEQYMIGTSLTNRLWFNKNKMALSLRSDVVKNPGIYLAFSPSPVTPNDFIDAITSDPKQNLTIFQQTATFDVMPNDYVTFRFEYSHRNANVPYFAGRGGTTSPDGWITTPTTGWRPDLKKIDDRLTLAVNFRL